MKHKRISKKKCLRMKGRHWVTGSKRRKGYCARNARRKHRRKRR